MKSQPVMFNKFPFPTTPNIEVKYCGCVMPAYFPPT